LGVGDVARLRFGAWNLTAKTSDTIAPEEVWASIVSEREQEREWFLSRVAQIEVSLGYGRNGGKPTTAWIREQHRQWSLGRPSIYGGGGDAYDLNFAS